MSNDQSMRNEEEKNCQEPENDVGGAGFHRRPVELGDDDDEDLGEDQVRNAEFAAQIGAVGLDCGLGCLEGRVVGGGQRVMFRTRKSKSPLYPDQKTAG